MSNILHCSVCGEEINTNEARWFNGQVYCPSCFEEITVECDHCGRRIHPRDNVGEDGFTLCSDCYDEHYVACYRCDTLLRREDAYYDDETDGYYCSSCFHRVNETRYIHDYSYKPEPLFYGEGRYIGVELEIDYGGKFNDNAKVILDTANKDDEYIYIKSDGSLDDGMEIVSHPMTLEHHMTSMPWKKVMDKALELGYFSHKTSTCGLHCHVDRYSLGKTKEEQEATISKILFIVEKFWDELLRFSRRTQFQMDRWAARYGIKERPKHMLDNVKKSGLGRYACVNLSNTDTIEFRMWRGTLKYNTFIATLQMVDEICKAAFLDEEELENMSWVSFIERIHSKELITYLKERRLYINEPVESEEEV